MGIYQVHDILVYMVHILNLSINVRSNVIHISYEKYIPHHGLQFLQ
jgi:hypothetical protein